MIDITMTAVLRPQVLDKTLSGFCTNLFGDMSNYRLVVNIDPVGDDVTYIDVLNVIYKYFDKDAVVYNAPEKPHFGKAVVWCWNNIENEYVFHLEDDWDLIKKVDINRMMFILNKNKDMAGVRLLVKKPKRPIYVDNGMDYYVFNNTFSLHPSLFRAGFLKGLVKILNPEKNPEMQVVSAKPKTRIRDYTSSWCFVMFNTKENPVVLDIGKEWRSSHGLGRYSANTGSAFVTWHKI